MFNVFAGYMKIAGTMTDKEKHEKRMVLEPRVFDILKEKYLTPLQDFWASYTVPYDAENRVVIIERRIHPNLEFILYNAAYFARGWGITIVCSDLNKNYIESLLKHNLDLVQVITMFEGNPEPSIGKNEYNMLLQSKEFYEALPSEGLLLMEMDTYLRKPIDPKILSYDYVACPYGWDETTSGGGLSFRKKSAMIDICNRYNQIEAAQDIFACRGVKALGYSMPPFTDATTYFSESVLYEDPVGVHQWWTFAGLNDPSCPFDEEFFTSLMSLQMYRELPY